MTTPATKTKTKTRMRKATPKPPPRVRVAVKAPPVHDPEAMATFGNKLTAAATAAPTLFVNPTYVQPLTAALGVLTAAIVAAQGGPDAAQSALVTATTKVHDIIEQHAAWVQGGANGLAPADAMSFITAAGFQVAKTRQRVAKSAPVLTNGAPTVVHFDLPPIPGAVMWFSEISSDGGKTFVRSVDTEHLKGDITGLTSGQSVTVRLRTFVRGSGYTPWTVLSIVVT
jgi:hypothetical protein